MRGFLKKILKRDQSVFTFQEFTLLWPGNSSHVIASRLAYYVKKGDLLRLRRGIYAKSPQYNKFEVAVKIYTPSYISFETVLVRAGMIFQFYSQITVASYLSRTIICDDQVYHYNKIQPEILTNPLGIEHIENYSIAVPERAFLDILYLYKRYHFDNLGPLNWNLVFSLLPLYNNKLMSDYIHQLYNKHKDLQ